MTPETQRKYHLRPLAILFAVPIVLCVLTMVVFGVVGVVIDNDTRLAIASGSMFFGFMGAFWSLLENVGV